nr:MAG TPA: hypothetical protein [Caudoviricetes sp.]
MSYLTPQKQEEVLSRGYDINIWISDRKGRKSSTSQETLLSDALNGSPFILLRNKKDELINESWLSEYIVNKYSDYTFYTEKINSNIVALKVKTPDDKVFIYCYGLYISLAQKYKSSYYKGFEAVKYVVWEECIPNTPLIQNIKYIRSRCMAEIYNVLSITSTVARDNKVQLIWLGNDISDNILNPVTIAFNLLERLSPNMEIEESIILNDREYSFYFNYFDFEGAVNHWLYNKNLHIANNIDSKNLVRYNIQLKSEFKTYYIYNAGNFFYISDKYYAVSENLNSGIYSTVDFFAKYNAQTLLRVFKLQDALNMLCTFYGVSRREIAHYFGREWYRGNIDFVPDSVSDNSIIIDLEKIVSMSLADIMRLNNYYDIKNVNELRKTNSVTYSNIKIMLLMEELGNILLFT